MAALEWLQLGGLAMAVLVLMSVIAVTLIIIKCWEFSEWRLHDRSFVSELLSCWDSGKLEASREVLQGTQGLLASVLSESVDLLSQDRLSPAQSRERIERLGNEALESGRRHLRALDLIGSLAPLVGLLGTVVGMIDAFQALQAAGERVEPAVLSAGIWKALMTTAAGLAVAIPVIVMAHYLEQRMARFQSLMESMLTRLLTRPLA